MSGIIPVDAQPEGENCSICRESLVEDVVQIVACAHRFHCVCIATWLQRFGHRTCPNCRRELYEAASLFSQLSSRFPTFSSVRPRIPDDREYDYTSRSPSPISPLSTNLPPAEEDMVDADLQDDGLERLERAEHGIIWSPDTSFNLPPLFDGRDPTQQLAEARARPVRLVPRTTLPFRRHHHHRRGSSLSNMNTRLAQLAEQTASDHRDLPTYVRAQQDLADIDDPRQVYIAMLSSPRMDRPLYLAPPPDVIQARILAEPESARHHSAGENSTGLRSSRRSDI